MTAHIKHFGSETHVITEIADRSVNFEDIEILDHHKTNMLGWFINLLKTEKEIEPRFQKKIHVNKIEIVEGDIYDAYAEATETPGHNLALNARALLGFCVLMQKRNKSQEGNVYFAILAEEKNLLFAKMEISKKIRIQIFPYGKKYLKHKKEKRGLILMIA